VRSLELAIKYLAGDRLQGTAAERATVTATYWYEQLLQNNSLVLTTDTAWYWTIIAMKNTTGSGQSTNQLVVWIDKVGSPTAITRARIYAADNSVLATSTDTVLPSVLTVDPHGEGAEFKFNFPTTTVPANGFVPVEDSFYNVLLLIVGVFQVAPKILLLLLILNDRLIMIVFLF